MGQDIVLVPCTPGLSKHWFLLVVLPKEKQILVLDSKPASFTKPSTVNAVAKMWRILQEIDNPIDANWWLFATNTPKDFPQQQNNFDCGVFLCLFARSLVLQSAVPAFRCHTIVEFHEQELINVRMSSFLANQYFILVVHLDVLMTIIAWVLSSCIKLWAMGRGFLTGQDETTLTYFICIFWPLHVIVGIGPFNFTQLNEVQQVYKWLKKSRKGNLNSSNHGDTTFAVCYRIFITLAFYYITNVLI